MHDFSAFNRVPTLGLENLEKWGGIFQSGKSQGILTDWKRQGKVRGNHKKYWKIQGIKKYYLLFFKRYLNDLCIIRWFKFTLKPPNRITRDKL